MKRPIRSVLLASAAVLAAYLVGVYVINSTQKPVAESTTPPALATLPSAIGDQITLTTWNLGYAGLGAQSNFIADGGSALLPPSRATVDDNLAGIVRTIGEDSSDIRLFQEVSNKSPLSYWAPVRDAVAGQFADWQTFYRPDVATRFIPFPLALDHGTFLAARYNPLSVETLPLPSEPGAMLGFLKRRYAIQIARFALQDRPGQLVVGNIHLSAFDDGGSTRQAQISAVLAFAEAEFAKGNHVIIGGDWNMVLADPAWPDNTDQKYLFWIYPFPREALPAGWTIAADATTPSVRTLYKPYVADENYTTSIDGFLVSPNVSVVSVSTRDLGFAPSDHQPVTSVFNLAR
ncbi:endonuclease/exonuclease/phosphatase family protein [Devosia aquimaris]|uniref:endonuclease/exonuclease/phosphatase family protein n=1 Tax=Devosia aquimaris TaxID=2866214 RepID=UPI001CD18C4F|nr:endonuclease/exonuclease/phosphatase family protein [Devosia sp. CJK-A8-3]